jgi:hypothetical protein
MTTATASAEYGAAEALATVLRNLPEEWPDGLTEVRCKDWVGNTVVLVVDGVEFHAVLVSHAPESSLNAPGYDPRGKTAGREGM